MSEKEYKIVWDFKQPSWDKKKKKPISFKGEMTGGIHPYTNKEHAEALAADLNRIYGEGTHWIEEVTK